MREVLRIGWREYLATVQTKGFLIGILVAPVLMSGSGLAMFLLEDRVDTTDQRVAVLDRTGVVAPHLAEAAEGRNANAVHDADGRKARPACVIAIVEPRGGAEQQRLELSERVRAKGLRGFVEVGPAAVHPAEAGTEGRTAHHAQRAALDDVRRRLRGEINRALRAERLRLAGVAEGDVPDFWRWSGLEPLGLSQVDEESGAVAEGGRDNEAAAVIAPLVSALLLFLMIMMGGVPLLNAVLEEKMQRIAEVLLGSASPFEIMAGKLLGHLGIAFTGAGSYLVIGTAAVHFTGVAAQVPFHVVPWFPVYMVMAVLMVGAVSMAVGSACNDAKEAQSVTLPVLLPFRSPMFVLVPVLKEPSSGFATAASLVPPFTPVLMLLRQSAPGGIPAWQPWVGLAGCLLFTALRVWAAGRVFRVGLLAQGQPPRLGTLVRWVLRG